MIIIFSLFEFFCVSSVVSHLPPSLGTDLRFPVDVRPLRMSHHISGSTRPHCYFHPPQHVCRPDRPAAISICTPVLPSVNLESGCTQSGQMNRQPHMTDSSCMHDQRR